MIKRVLPLACVLILVASCAATAQTIGGGIKAGVDISNMSISGGGVSITPSSRTGLIIGGFVDLPVAPHIAIQPEVLFAMKGTTLPAEEIGVGAGDTTAKVDYIDVPVLVKISVPSSSSAVPYVFAGPNFGFLLSAKATASGTADVDIKSEFKTTDVGLAFGGGVAFGRLLVEARYTLGLTNIAESTLAAEGLSAKNHGFAIMGGIKF